MQTHIERIRQKNLGCDQISNPVRISANSLITSFDSGIVLYLILCSNKSTS